MLLNDEVLAKRMQELEKGTNKVFGLVFERLDTLDEEILELKRDKPLFLTKRKKMVSNNQNIVLVPFANSF